MEIIGNSTFDEVKFHIRDVAFPLIEGPSVPNAQNIRATLNDAFNEKSTK